MSTALPSLLADLQAETAVVEELLDRLTPEEWDRATPAAGWSVRDQVSHLAFFDEAAVAAATDPELFRRDAAVLLDLGPTFPDVIAERFRDMPVGELTAWFRNARTDLLGTFVGLDGKARVPWFGPEMSVLSSATARLMETWAHGQDLYDAFDLTRPPTDRLRHIAHLGVRTLGFSFSLNGRDVPDVPVRVVLDAPGGDTWSWGDEEATDVVRGSALDFCHVVTQRRHLYDTGLLVTGPVAREWLSIAQAFAGAPGTGREPSRHYLKETS